MSILTLLVTLLLSGSNGFAVHTNEVSGGGPILGPQAAAAAGTAPTVDEVIGGGPISMPKPSNAPPGMTVDGVSGGGPIL